MKMAHRLEGGHLTDAPALPCVALDAQGSLGRDWGAKREELDEVARRGR